MINILKITVYLVLICLPNYVLAADCIKFDKQNYCKAWSNKTQAFEKIEFLRKSETVKAWNKMITITNYPERKNLKATMPGYFNSIKTFIAIKPEIISLKPESKNPDEAYVILLLLAPDKLHYEYVVNKFYTDVNSVKSVFYSQKIPFAKKVDFTEIMKNRKPWIEQLQKISAKPYFVTKTEDPPKPIANKSDKTTADTRPTKNSPDKTILNNQDQALLDEAEASIAKIDDSKLLERYGAKGSGIELTNFSILLKKNSSKISGATSIHGDPSGFGFSITLSGDFLFKFDKSDLTSKAQNALKEVLDLHQEYEGYKVSIHGHTDSKGSNKYNIKLSNLRANSVKKWFISQKIDKKTISTKGLGETKPIAKNSIKSKDNPKGRALNRRVEISIKTKKKVNHLPTVSKTSSIR